MSSVVSPLAFADAGNGAHGQVGPGNAQDDARDSRSQIRRAPVRPVLVVAGSELDRDHWVVAACPAFADLCSDASDEPILSDCQPLACRNSALTPNNRQALTERLATVDDALVDERLGRYPPPSPRTATPQPR